jgi:DNA-binding beta-propeller fold protein YncE
MQARCDLAQERKGGVTMFFEVETFAGTGAEGTEDGPVATATFNRPTWLTVTPSGVIYVAETFHNGIRKIENGVVSTLTNRAHGTLDGPLSTASFSGPSGIVSDRAGNLYIADQGNHRIRKIDTSGDVTTIAGPSGREQLRGWVDDLLRVSDHDVALFSRPKAMAIDASDANLYVVEHHRIRRLPLRFQPGVTILESSTLAAVGIKGFADGPAPVAQFANPLGLAVTQTGDLLVADTGNFRIRRVTPSGMVTTLAGDGVAAVPTDHVQFADGRPALQARFERPSGLAVDQAGTVWVSDRSHVRMYFPLANTVATACTDSGSHQEPLKFTNATSIALSGDKIFVVDGNKIVRLTPHED